MKIKSYGVCRHIPLVIMYETTWIFKTVGNSYLLTPWCRVLLEKLTGLQLVKKYPHFTEPEGSLPHSQAPATCLYPGPAQSSQYTHIPPPGDIWPWKKVFICIMKSRNIPRNHSMNSNVSATCNRGASEKFLNDLKFSNLHLSYHNFNDF